MLGNTLSIHARLAALLAALATTFGVMTLVAPAANATTVTVTVDGMTFTADDDFPGNGATVTAYDAAAGAAVTVPDSVTINGVEYAVKKIGFSAFRAKSLTSVTLPVGLTSLGQLSFEGNSLTEVTIPDSVTTIGGNAFAGNDLTAIVIPDSVTSMGHNVFAVNNIASATLSQNLTTIPGSAFEVNSLSSIAIPEGVTVIETGAFWGNSLSAVSIPSSVTTIGSRAFDANAGLSSVTFAGAAPTVVDANASDESFDTASGWLVLHYLSSNAGWTPLTWHGYTAMQELRATAVGNPREGYTLTATPNQTIPPAINVAYQWYADGKSISGATAAELKLAKAQAARRVTVKITASTTGGAYTEATTSPSTAVVSSRYKRIVRSAYTIHRGKGFTVTGTGFKAGQTVRIRLDNVTRWSGHADSRGIVRRYVTFKSGTKYGTRSVKVQYKSGGKWRTGISTSVYYTR